MCITIRLKRRGRRWAWCSLASVRENLTEKRSKLIFMWASRAVLFMDGSWRAGASTASWLYLNPQHIRHISHFSRRSWEISSSFSSFFFSSLSLRLPSSQSRPVTLPPPEDENQLCLQAKLNGLPSCEVRRCRKIHGERKALKKKQNTSRGRGGREKACPRCAQSQRKEKKKLFSRLAVHLMKKWFKVLSVEEEMEEEMQSK